MIHTVYWMRQEPRVSSVSEMESMEDGPMDRREVLALVVVEGAGLWAEEGVEREAAVVGVWGMCGKTLED